MVTPAVVEERHPASSSPEEAAEFEAALDRGSRLQPRRRLLVGMLAAAFARSRRGARDPGPVARAGARAGAVRDRVAEGQSRSSTATDCRSTPTDLPLDSVVTVFPEGAVGSADSQTLLIRVPPDASRASMPSRASWAPDGFVAYSKVCTHAGCPVGLYRATRAEAHLPVPPVDVRRAHGRDPGLRAGRPAAAAAADPAAGGRHVRRRRRLPGAGRAELLEHHVRRRRMTRRDDDRPATAADRGPRRRPGDGPRSGADGATDRARPPRRLARRADRVRRLARTRPAQGLPRPLVVPARRDRPVLLRRSSSRPASFLTFFFVADTPADHLRRAVSRRSRAPTVSAAFDSVMRLSFEVRAGLLMRQIHHWTARRLRGRDRRPRLPRVLHRRRSAGRARSTGSSASGSCCSPSPRASPATRCRTTSCPGPGSGSPTRSSLSIPFIGPWLAYLIFGGEFPTPELIGRLLRVPHHAAPGPDDRRRSAVHLGILLLQKHTQFRGGRARETTSSAATSGRGQAFRSLGLFFLTAAVLAAPRRARPDQPGLGLRPVRALSRSSSPAQPDWYLGWLEGLAPARPELRADDPRRDDPEPFLPAIVLPGDRLRRRSRSGRSSRRASPTTDREHHLLAVAVGGPGPARRSARRSLARSSSS